MPVWFLKPKHTLESVARELVEGLEKGTIVLGNSPTLPTDQNGVKSVEPGADTPHPDAKKVCGDLPGVSPVN
jgi:hypothetical protein